MTKLENKLIKILNKYSNKKLFDYQWENFKYEFFGTMYNLGPASDLSLRTEVFLNAVLEEENLPFVVDAGIERNKESIYCGCIYRKIVDL